MFKEFCASVEKLAASRRDRATAAITSTAAISSTTDTPVESKTVREIQRFRSDNGKGEYDNKQFRAILKEKGIAFEPSAPYTPHQNGVSERKIQMIQNKAMCMLRAAYLPDTFWAEAASTAAYIINRSPTAALNNSTPYEKWHGVKPDISHFRVFGCVAYVHVPDAKCKKLQSKTQVCMFVGYMKTAL